MSLYTSKGLLRLAEIVQNARFRRNMTQKQFALACELSTATICRLESGDTVKTPTDDTLEKVARFIGLTREELKAIAEQRNERDRATLHSRANGEHNVVLEIVPVLDRLSEAQLDLVFQKIIEHHSMYRQRLTQYARVILARLDSLD